MRVTQRLIRIHKFYLVECLKAEDVFEIAQKYCDILHIKQDLRNLIFKNKTRFEYLPLEKRLIILKICYKIFENFKKFVEEYRAKLHLTKEVLFKHRTG